MSNTMTKAIEAAKATRFGIELEVKGLNRIDALRAVQTVVGGTIVNTYYKKHVKAADGRKWHAVTDASLNGTACEVVSPICKYEDIETVQKIARALRAAGARVDRECGIHIHIDGARFDGGKVRNLIKQVRKNEEYILEALGIRTTRANGTWCRRIQANFADTLEAAKGDLSMSELRTAWYGGQHNDYRAQQAYDHSRYHGVNLHSLFFRGTIEFRWFAGTLHAGRIKAYLQFVLALAGRAQVCQQASGKVVEFDASKSKWVFRNVLNRLGLRGDEFKTCRFHMMRNLQGSAAYQGTRGDA